MASFSNILSLRNIENHVLDSNIFYDESDLLANFRRRSRAPDPFRVRQGDQRNVRNRGHNPLRLQRSTRAISSPDETENARAEPISLGELLGWGRPSEPPSHNSQLPSDVIEPTNLDTSQSTSMSLPSVECRDHASDETCGIDPSEKHGTDERESSADNVNDTSAVSELGNDDAEFEPELCCICQDPLMNNLVALNSCGHVMHEGCAELYVKSKFQGIHPSSRRTIAVPCPVCRTELNRPPRTLYGKVFIDLSRYASRSLADELLRKELKEQSTQLKSLMAQKAAWESEKVRMERQISNLTQQVSSFRENHREGNDDRKRLRKDVETLRVENNRLGSELATNREEAQQLQKQLTLLRVEVDNERGELHRAQRQLAEASDLKESSEQHRIRAHDLEKELRRLEKENRVLKEQNIALIRLKRNTVEPESAPEYLGRAALEETAPPLEQRIRQSFLFRPVNPPMLPSSIATKKISTRVLSESSLAADRMKKQMKITAMFQDS